MAVPRQERSGFLHGLEAPLATAFLSLALVGGALVLNQSLNSPDILERAAATRFIVVMGLGAIILLTGAAIGTIIRHQ